MAMALSNTLASDDEAVICTANDLQHEFVMVCIQTPCQPMSWKSRASVRPMVGTLSVKVMLFFFGHVHFPGPMASDAWVSVSCTRLV